MYKEVLDYIRDLGNQRALPEDRDRQEEVRECMNKISDEICRIYGNYGFTCDRDKGYAQPFNEKNQSIARYLTADMKAVSPDSEISIGIYGERSPEKKARYCISIGVRDSILHNKGKIETRKKYYSFLNVKLRNDLCYQYKNLYVGLGEKDPETIFVHNDEDEKLKNTEQKDIRKYVNEERMESVPTGSDGKDIELCYLVESETEDGKIRTEEQLRTEVIYGVGRLLPYYRYVQDYPDNDHSNNGKNIQVSKTPKNMILYGPPGTGKTYTTAAYAVSFCDRFYTLDTLKEIDHTKIMERYHELEQEGRIGFTTFHQSYGYEDFMEGIRPVLDKENREKTDASSSGTVSGSQNQPEEQKPEKSGNLEYTIEPGVFKAFCEKAEKESEKPYVFIIDEINRGNISRIFGELITLIEESKRKGEEDERSVILPYSKKEFSVPSNVYIIGTMNTADRSIALLDTALRRRFSFVEMMPDTEVLKDIKIGIIDVQKLLEIINQRIEVLYDREHTIGHAYFCGLKGKNATLDGLKNVFKKSVLPLLQEYFFDDYEKIAMVLGDNQKSNSDHKFIVEAGEIAKYKKNVKNIWTLFGRNLEDMDVMLQHKRYMINEKAFDCAESYIQIYEPSRKN